MAIQINIMPLCFDAEETQRTLILEKEEITIGRLPSNDIVLHRSEVSGRHARLRIQDKGNGDKASLAITDLGSLNGTMVETKSLEAYQEVTISPNDRLFIGAYLIKPIIVEATKTSESDTSTFEVELASSETSSGLENREPLAAKSDNDYTATTRISASELQSMQESPETPSEKQVKTAPPKEIPTEFSAFVHEKIELVPLENINFTAIRLYSLRGRITHRGLPLAGIKVDGGTLGRTTSGVDGNFCFSNIPEGTWYSLSASHYEYLLSSNCNTGKLESDEFVGFSATKLFAVKGKVTHKGRPLSGVEIDGGKLGKTITADDGSYLFKEVPENTTFSLTASKGGFVFARSISGQHEKMN